MGGGVKHNMEEEPVKLRGRGWTGNQYLTPILSRILKKLGIEITVDGADIQQTATGINLSGFLGAGGAASAHPLLVEYVGLNYTVVPGTLAANVTKTPTLGGTLLSALPAPTGAITGTGTEYVYLKVEGTITAAHNYAHTVTLDAVSVLDGSSLPANVLTGIWYIQLATFIGGVKTSQDIETSLSLEWCDTGAAASEAIMTSLRT